MDINFDIESALASARSVRTNMAQTCSSDTGGLKRHDQPSWAGKDLQKLGVTGAVLRKISSGMFVRRSPEDDLPYREHVARQLAAQQPLFFRLGCGPLKNMQVCRGSQQPDCAEYLMFFQLYTMKENQTQLPWQLRLPFPDALTQPCSSGALAGDIAA